MNERLREIQEKYKAGAIIELHGSRRINNKIMNIVSDFLSDISFLLDCITQFEAEGEEE